jgi:hypothetical protein
MLPSELLVDSVQRWEYEAVRVYKTVRAGCISTEAGQH